MNMAVIEEFADSRFDTVKHEEGEMTSMPRGKKRTIKAVQGAIKTVGGSTLDNIDTIRLIDNPLPASVHILKNKSPSRLR